VPKACLKRDKTIIILVKDVTINKIAGARERIVSRITSWMSVFTFSGSVEPPDIVRLTLGREKDWAAKDNIGDMIVVTKNIRKNNPIIYLTFFIL
jgi:hypothetical protein